VTTLTADQMDMVKILENHAEQMEVLEQSLDSRNSEIREATIKGDWDELERILDKETDKLEDGVGSTNGDERSRDTGHGENLSQPNETG